jgi:hypothetical protein
MSQLYDYFACSRRQVERWAKALAAGDEELQERIEAAMPRLVTLKNLGQDDFTILARCAAGGGVDVVEAAGAIDLVRAISPDEGPWVMAFRRPDVNAVAEMRVDGSLLRRWAKHVAEYRGGRQADIRHVLSAEAARTLKELCGLAVKERLGVFACFYG